MSVLMNEKAIPKTNTYPNWGHGYVSDELPPPILGNCGPKVSPTAPDIAGTWKVVEVNGRLTGRTIEEDGDSEDDTSVKNDDDDDDEESASPMMHPHVGFVLRIEQAGNRVVLTTQGNHKVIHDMRCDGTAENGIDDVSGSDHMKHVRASAYFVKDKKRGNVLVIHPLSRILSKVANIMSVVEYWREGEQVMWTYGLYTIHMERVEGSEIGKSVAFKNDEKDIPKAHTYPFWGHGYGLTSAFPPLSLRGIDVPIVEGAPDLRGTWQIVEYKGRMFNRRVDENDKGWPKAPPPKELLQRIEQAGNRIVITTGGDTEHKVIHDITCDDTFDGCADDVSGKDLVSRIRATGKYVRDKKRGGVHRLNPSFNKIDMNIPGTTVERWREGKRLVWKYGFYRMYCERVDDGAASTPSVTEDKKRKRSEI